MIQLIAESGSTKTSWYLINEENILWTGQTLGMNPYFANSSDLIIELKKIADSFSWISEDNHTTHTLDTAVNEGRINLEIESIDIIHFYGAGTSNPNTQSLLNDAFSKVFGMIPVRIETDILAAARALFGSNEGIACIIGTGSNCAVYNGNGFSDFAPSLGFSLGDEGSAGYFGKRIIRDYYVHRLPSVITSYLENNFDMDIHHTLDRMYRKKHGNAYIASFSSLMAEFKDHEYVVDLIERGMEEFNVYQLGYFKSISQNKVGMVGSVAYFHQDRIRKCLSKYGWDLVKVIQHPIQELVGFHQNKMV